VFANGEELEATLIGSDVFTDLALLEVKVDFEVNAFKLGDSSLVKVGENALAIGSPLGLSFQGSVTMGIISGKDRVVPVDLDNNGTDDWDSIVLQTDAAINPGNSGGPLINLAGELIGITSMKIADSSVEGMGFAIPINEIIPIIQQLKDNGEVIRPVVGISAVSLDELAVYQKSYYGIRLDLNAGLYVMSVIKGSPAELSGIKEGDVITAFDNTNITSFKEFRKLLYTKNVGDVVTISYERAGKSTTVNVVLQ
jgi:serine protease Do